MLLYRFILAATNSDNMEQDMSATRLSISQVCKKLKLSKRSVQRIAKSKGIPKDLEGYIFTEDAVRQKESATSRNKGRSKEDVLGDLELGLHEVDGKMINVFSKEEYKSFELALIERKQLLQQVKQLQDWKDSFLRFTQERNLIEAKDKGLFKEIDDVEEAQVMDDTDIQKHLSQKRAEVIKPKVNTSEQWYRSDYFGWMEKLKD